MNDTQKLVAGALLAGAGLLTGDATLLTLAGGVGVNWSSEALAGLLRTLPGQAGEPLTRAYGRAIRRAVDELRHRYPHTGSACTLLPAFDLVAASAGSLAEAQFLQPLEPDAIQAALAASLDSLLFGHDEREIAYLQQHLLPAAARAFRAELDGDDRAWLRYHGWLIEQMAAAYARSTAAASAPATASAPVPVLAPAPAALPDLGKVLAALADVDAARAALAAGAAALEALIGEWQTALARRPAGPTVTFHNTGVQTGAVVQGVEVSYQSARAEQGGTATVVNISGAALPPAALAVLHGDKAGSPDAGLSSTYSGAQMGAQVGALHGELYGELHGALLDAFTPASLQQMLRFALGAELDHIAGGPNFGAVVAELIGWARRGGRLPELVQAAHAAVPGNARLTAVLRSFDPPVP
jgi:hypothetical protein